MLSPENICPGHQTVPDDLHDGDDAGAQTEAEDAPNVGHQSGESDVDVLGYFLTVRLFEVDVDHGCVLPHVSQYFGLEQVNPLCVITEAALSPEVVTAGVLHHILHVPAEAGVPLLQRPPERPVRAGEAVQLPDDDTEGRAVVVALLPRVLAAGHRHAERLVLAGRQAGLCLPPVLHGPVLSYVIENVLETPERLAGAGTV